MQDDGPPNRPSLGAPGAPIALPDLGMGGSDAVVAVEGGGHSGAEPEPLEDVPEEPEAVEAEPLENIPSVNLEHEIPDSQPEPELPDSQPEHEIPDSQPEHEIPESQPEHEIPESQPEHEIPDSQPEHEIPDSQPEPELPDSQPEPELPSSQPELLAFPAHWDEEEEENQEMGEEDGGEGSEYDQFTPADKALPLHPPLHPVPKSKSKGWVNNPPESELPAKKGRHLKLAMKKLEDLKREQEELMLCCE